MDIKVLDLTSCQTLALLQLIRTQGLKPLQRSLLLKECEDNPQEAVKALTTSASLCRHYGVTSLFSEKEAWDDITQLRRLDGSFLEIREKGGLLSTFVYAIGEVSLIQERKVIAIVGSRQPSLAGLKLAEKFASDLGKAGFSVISGLARGIDAAVHKACLETGTVAVIANGLNVAYPQENRYLQEEIKKQGLLLSTFPLGTKPNRRFFPRRNHLIARLSLGTVVIEAHEHSGSLITARCARDLHKKLWAVPGSPLDPLAQGPNKLIKEGAILVENTGDILKSLGHTCEELKHSRPGHNASYPHTLTQNILNVLSFAVPASIEDLAQSMHCSIGDMRAHLFELEMEGKIVNSEVGVCLL